MTEFRVPPPPVQTDPRRMSAAELDALARDESSRLRERVRSLEAAVGSLRMLMLVLVVIVVAGQLWATFRPR